MRLAPQARPRRAFNNYECTRLEKIKISSEKLKSLAQIKCIKELHCNIFGGFDGIKGLKLIMYSKQNMKIFEDPREAPQDENSLPKLELTASTTSVLKTVDNWLGACQGKSLILISSNEELITVFLGFFTSLMSWDLDFMQF
ncbi:hypothetical protein ACS0TY_018742 [Phlomoides rotata]